MQSDAHVTFTKGWDVDIIAQMEATGDEMAVLSTYLTGKKYTHYLCCAYPQIKSNYSC